jgi:hypothetical protein
MTPAHWNTVITLWSLGHGYAHLAIAGRFMPFAGSGNTADFVAATLPAVLEGAMGGLLPPPAARKRTTRPRAR